MSCMSEIYVAELSHICHKQCNHMSFLSQRLHPRPQFPASLRIYEAHVGIGSQEKRVASFNEFTGVGLKY